VCTTATLLLQLQAASCNYFRYKIVTVLRISNFDYDVISCS